MIEKIKALISVVELTKDKVGLETLREILLEAEKKVWQANKFNSLVEKIEEHQTEEDSDLCSIGELVLDELDLWN